MILFNDFKLHYQNIRAETDAAVMKVLESGWYILGPEVEGFEREFAEYLGCRFAVGVASGTEAIALALMACEIGEGHEVITTNVTAFPTITGIIQSGARPVVVDIRSQDGLIDPDRIKEKINDKTRAIIPVHLYGQSCDMGRIMEMAQKHGLRVIEDCAQSSGATCQGKMTGTIGDCGAFSFYPTKNLGAFGDGGAVTTNCEEYYKKLLQLRNYGQTVRYYHESRGINSRLDEIQAAVLRVKLKYLSTWNSRRRQIAVHYRQDLKGVECLVENSYGQSVYHLFVVRSDRRKGLMDHLKVNGIQTLIHYPVPVSGQKDFRWQSTETFPESQRFADQILSIPIYPELSDENIQYIVKKINEY